MLPKVASQILHHTSRAVAVIQNQTGSTIRTVLHTSGQSSSNLGGRSGSGSSNSGWGGTAEPGGPKTHSGSRFHPGFSSSARIVAHADPSASHVDSFDYSDDYLDTPTPLTSRLGAHTRQRLRTTTLAQVVQNENGAPSVLKTLKHHVREKHAFAAATLPSSHTEHSPADVAPPPLVILSADSATPAVSSIEEPLEPERASSPTSDLITSLTDARARNDPKAIHSIVKSLRESGSLKIGHYNQILEALRQVRSPGDSLRAILETYNEMLERSILPNSWTYGTLILAFTDRDAEVTKKITYFERRVNRRKAWGLDEEEISAADEARISQLRSENNFGSALKLFQAASLLSSTALHPATYTALLRACAYHANVDAAIHIFAHLEKRPDIQPSALPYTYLINAYARAGDLQGAEEVFEEFKKASALGKIAWESRDTSEEGFSPSGRSAQIGVWNYMIDAYFRCGQPDKGLSLLEQMMDAPAGLAFTPADVPLPSSTTFSTIIEGFCRAGDTESALSWFRRLLKEGKDVTDVVAPSIVPPKPNRQAWAAILVHLATQDNRIQDLNQLWSIAAREYPRVLRGSYHALVLQGNLRFLESHPDVDSKQGLAMLDFLLEDVLSYNLSSELVHIEFGGADALVATLVKLYFRFGGLDSALAFARKTASHTKRSNYNKEEQVEALVSILIDHLRALPVSGWSFAQALSLARVAAYAGKRIDPPLLLDAYVQARDADSLPELKKKDWEVLLDTSLDAASNKTGEYTSSSIADSLLTSLGSAGIDMRSFRPSLRTRLVNYINSTMTTKKTSDLQSESEARSVQEDIEESPTTPGGVFVDVTHANYVDEYRLPKNDLTPLAGYDRLQQGIQMGVYPTPYVLGRLINALGRVSDLQRVQDVYEIAQTVLAADKDTRRQSAGWFSIEDNMTIALAHAGDVDAAHVHRMRILEQGGSPSPDAYGALVHHVKDTTDDTANAMALFQEAVSRQVSPNLYLYNTIISKLAKARKADLALQLFQELKLRGIKPSSVTYGSVIAACCRVGDAQSAETLFEEMSSQPSFKPRIPPYNTMMQFYTQTKPDRERVLFYYDALLRAKVAPTAHTYKLLLDAYGTIEPLDFDAMQSTFNELVANTRVPVLGTHWAALINAWGCAGKNLDKAIETFQAIATHPRTQNAALPDAVCFEALLNVLVTLHRNDLLADYRQQLVERGIHMTAYIANLLIKGYAAAGDMEEARRVFESLVDPPEGVAAPNNHAPLDQQGSPIAVSPNDPVYREPSTWEAMIRAELSHGNVDNAAQLLARAEARYAFSRGCNQSYQWS
ncbi:unnamed protein product [Somion occarium]|uniref:Pentacotripeptide-repeat region of PRORP domain-containing protein n=1 Tax=Somion occarium TaxID=3059160 RepID=A0ABP1D265_9APHY